jgi:hypothetical protein
MAAIPTSIVTATTTDVAAWAAVVLSATSILYSFFFASVKHAREMATLTVKVDTMWGFTMRQAVSRAVDNDLMKHNSPLEITAKGYNYIKPVAQELWEYYQKFPTSVSKLTDADLALAIERDFGERLLNEICIPNGLLFGECVILAIEAIRKNGNLPPHITLGNVA